MNIELFVNLLTFKNIIRFIVIIFLSMVPLFLIQALIFADTNFISKKLNYILCFFFCLLLAVIAFITSNFLKLFRLLRIIKPESDTFGGKTSKVSNSPIWFNLFCLMWAAIFLSFGILIIWWVW